MTSRHDGARFHLDYNKREPASEHLRSKRSTDRCGGLIGGVLPEQQEVLVDPNDEREEVVFESAGGDCMATSGTLVPDRHLVPRGKSGGCRNRMGLRHPPGFTISLLAVEPSWSTGAGYLANPIEPLTSPAAGGDY